MRRSLINNARILARKSAILLLLLQFTIFPAIYYSQSHLHFFQGVYYIHWHPLVGKNQKSAENSPLAHHKHTLRELLTIQASQGSPAVQNQVQTVAFLALYQSLEPLPYHACLSQHSVDPVEARAPPAV